MSPGEGRESRGRLERWLVSWGWVALIASTVLILFAGATGYVAHLTLGRLDHAAAAAERDDPHWRLTDPNAGREVVPDAENAAIVVAEASAMLPENWPPDARRSSAMTVSEPDWDVERALGRLEIQGSIGTPRRLDGPTARILRDELLRRSPALARARELVALHRGRFGLVPGKLVYEYDDEVWDRRCEWRVSRLLEADVAVAAFEGRFDDAVFSCRALLGVTRAIGDEPFGWSQERRMRLAGTSAHLAAWILALGEPSPDALAALQRDLLAERDWPWARHLLRGERASLFESLRRRDARAMGLAAFPVRMLSSAHGAESLEWMAELYALANRPEPDQLAALVALRGRIAEFPKSRLVDFAQTAAYGLMTDRVARAFEEAIRRRADLGATAILVAAERHRRATGTWPSSVAEIPKAVFPAPPLDPYTGRPFRILRIDEGLRVYSVGPNRRDEDGEHDGVESRDDVVVVGYDVDRRGRTAEDQPPAEPEEPRGGRSTGERGR